MEHKTIEKMIEIIKKYIGEVTLIKEQGESELSFSYDKVSDRYSVTLSRILEDGKKEKKEKKDLSLEEALPFFMHSEFRNEITDFCEKQTKREEKYKQTKERLTQELTKMELSDKDKQTMQTIIEQVSQLPEYVGFGNRFILTNIEDFKEELRLTDETGWDTAGETLHLQLIQSVDFRNDTS